MNKVSISIVIALFPPRWIGGTEVATYQLANQLASRNFDITIYTTGYHKCLTNTKEGNVQVVRLGKTRFNLINKLFFYFTVPFKLAKAQQDIIQAQGLMAGFAGLVGKYLTGKPLIIYARGSDIYNNSLALLTIGKIALSKADVLIALSNHMKSRLMEVTLNNKIHVVGNGIDLLKYKISNHTSFNTGDIRIVLYVGSLKKVKGTEYLIKAFKLILNKRNNVKLVIVGDGPEKKRLVNIKNQYNLGPAIEFTGSLPHENIFGKMLASDLIVLPSLSEGFPNVILEAMAAGLPIVATNVTSISEIITDGTNGFLVDPKSPSQLSEKIIQLLDSKKLRFYISRNNIQTVRKYSLDQIADKIEHIYHTLIKNHSC